MPTINSMNLAGHLGRDAEPRYTSGNKMVLDLSVALSRKVKDVEVTTWTKVVLWDKQAEYVSHAKKGDLLVANNVEYRSEEYDAKDGTKKTKHYFVAHGGSRCFVVPKGAIRGAGGDHAQASESRGMDVSGNTERGGGAASAVDVDDNLPF